MRPIRPFRLLLPLLLACLTAGGALARSSQDLPGPAVTTEPVSLGGEGRLELALLTMPEGAPGIFPLAVLLADLDGPGRRSAVYGQRLLENGWALLEPAFDYETGPADSRVPPPERLGAAIAAVAEDARIDAGRLVVIGFGAGARTALEGWAQGAHASTLVLLYPGCDASLLAMVRAARPADPTSRVLLLHGDEDDASSSADCAALAAAFPVGVAVQHRVLRGAGYAWDSYDLVRPGGHTLPPHPADDGRRVVSRPDLTTTLVVADRVLGFVQR